MIEYTDESFTQALNAVAATQEGKIILHELMLYTRFNGDILAEGSQENTYANALLRRAYMFFRNRIDQEHLKDIEFNMKRKKDDGYGDESPASKRTIIHRPRGLPRKAVGREGKV